MLITAETGSRDWMTPEDWVGGVVPTLGDTFLIPSGCTMTATFAPSTFEIMECSGTVAAGGELTFVNTGEVVVNQHLQRDFRIDVAGYLGIESHVRSYGLIVVASGGVVDLRGEGSYNHGVIIIKSGGTGKLRSSSSRSINYGAIIVQGTLELKETSDNLGLITCRSGGTVVVEAGFGITGDLHSPIVIETGGTLTNLTGGQIGYGVVILESGASNSTPALTLMTIGYQGSTGATVELDDMKSSSPISKRFVRVGGEWKAV